MRCLPGVVVALWLGAMGFLAFAVAPAAFTTLERDAAGRLVSAIFPRYYLAGTALGAIALAACAVRAARSGARMGDWAVIGLVVLMVAVTLYAWTAVLPAAHAAREAMHRPGAGAEAAAQFARLHRISGVLNGIAMLAGAAALAAEVLRRP